MNGRTVLYFDAKTHCAMLLVICMFTEYTATPTILQLVGFGVSPYPCGRAISRPSGVSTFREFWPVSSIVVQRITDLP